MKTIKICCIPKYQRYASQQKTKWRLVRLVRNADKYYTSTYYTGRHLAWLAHCGSHRRLVKVIKLGDKPWTFSRRSVIRSTWRLSYMLQCHREFHILHPPSFCSSSNAHDVWCLLMIQHCRPGTRRRWKIALRQPWSSWWSDGCSRSSSSYAKSSGVAGSTPASLPFGN